MTVAHILQAKGREVLTARPETPIGDVARTLGERKVGAIVITDGNDRILGILSERDIVREIGRNGASALGKTAADLMTKSVKTCAESDSINKVMHKMTIGRFRHLPVETNGKLAGIVSIGDVVKRRMEEIEREAEDIRSYIATA